MISRIATTEKDDKLGYKMPHPTIHNHVDQYKRIVDLLCDQVCLVGLCGVIYVVTQLVMRIRYQIWNAKK